MTTGNQIIGNSSNTPIYWYRTWNGVNGKLVNPPSSPVAYFRRRLVSEGRWVTVKPKFDRLTFLPKTLGDKERLRRLKLLWRQESRGAKKFYIPPVYALESVMRYHRVRLKDSWNAYSMSGLTGRQVKGTNPTYGIYLGFQSRLGLVTTWTGNDDLKLYSKLADAVKGHSFDLGVALAEGHQTVAMLLTTLRRVTGAVASLKKGRIDLALRHLGAVPEPRHLKNYRRFNPHMVRKTTKSGKVVFHPDALTVDAVSAMWLEIQYGWRPLYSDVYESMKAYSAITDKSRASRISVSLKKRAKTTGTLANAWNRFDEETVSKRITYEMEEQLSTLRSLNLLDPRAATWEVLPWSFVADWFLPIGSYLSALSTIPHLKGRFLVQTKDVCDITKIGLSSSVLYSGAKAVHREMTFTRSVSTSLSVPLPRFKTIREALSVGHVENALALLQQAVSFKK